MVKVGYLKITRNNLLTSLWFISKLKNKKHIKNTKVNFAHWGNCIITFHLQPFSVSAKTSDQT